MIYQLFSDSSLLVIVMVMMFSGMFGTWGFRQLLRRGIGSGKFEPHTLPAPQGVGRDAGSQRMLDDAIRFKTRGEYLKAGWIYVQLGMYGKAAEVHSLAGDRVYAADLYLKARDNQRAARLYEEQGLIEDSAIALEAGGLWGDAAHIRATLGQLPQAAELYARAGRALEAAAIFHHLGVLFKAGQLYEEAGLIDLAADVYADIIDRRGPEQMAGRPEVVKVLVRGGRAAEAANILEASGKAAVAADLCLRHDDIEAAVAIWERNPTDCAQQLAPRVEAQDTPLEAYAKLFNRVGAQNLAARAYQRMGAHGEAARLFDQTGDYLTAAEMLVQNGKRLEAAEAFKRAGAYGRAAAIYEEIGQYQDAAVAYEEGGLTFESAEMWRHAGDLVRALRWYQRVPPVHPRYLEASAHFCRGMVKQGEMNLAVEKYLEVTDGLPVGDASADIFYDMANLLVRLGRHGEAAAAFHALIRFDVGYKDAKDKAKETEASAKKANQDIPKDKWSRTSREGSTTDRQIGSMFNASHADVPRPQASVRVPDPQGPGYLASSAANRDAEIRIEGSNTMLGVGGLPAPDTMMGTLAGGPSSAPAPAPAPPPPQNSPIGHLAPFQALGPGEQEAFVGVCQLHRVEENQVILQGNGQSPGAIVVVAGSLVIGADGVQPSLRSPGWVVGAGPSLAGTESRYWAKVHESGTLLVYSPQGHQSLGQAQPALAEKVRSILLRASADLS